MNMEFLKNSQVLIGMIVSVVGIVASGLTFYYVGKTKAEVLDATIELRLNSAEKRIDVIEAKVESNYDSINKRLDTKFDVIENRLLNIEKSIVRVEQTLNSNKR